MNNVETSKMRVGTLKMRKIAEENKELEKLLEEVNDDRVYGIKVNNVYLKGELFDETIEFLAYKIPEVMGKIQQEEVAEKPQEKSKIDEKANLLMAYKSLISKKKSLEEMIIELSGNALENDTALSTVFKSLEETKRIIEWHIKKILF